MGGYDTNPARSVNNVKGSTAFTIAPELLGRSDWERHELDIAISELDALARAVAIVAVRVALDRRVRARQRARREDLRVRRAPQRWPRAPPERRITRETPGPVSYAGAPAVSPLARSDGAAGAEAGYSRPSAKISAAWTIVPA